LLKLFNLKELYNLFLILLGTISLALSVVLFFVPHNFTTGGTPGMAILVHSLSGFSMGSIIIGINIPLIIVGIKYLGKLFAIKTIITIALLSIFIDIFTATFKNELLIQNILVSAIFGGAVIGFGVGLIIKANSSAGGSTIIAKIMASKFYMKPANVMLIIDAIIIVSSIYVFKDFEKAVLSIMSIYATTKAINVVLTGTLNTKVIKITSNKAELIGEEIRAKLGIEGTLLTGTSILNNQDKKIILIVLDIKKLGILKEIISENDKDAFMIVSEASEMLGRGH